MATHPEREKNECRAVAFALSSVEYNILHLNERLNRAIHFLEEGGHAIPENAARVGSDGKAQVVIDGKAYTQEQVIALARKEGWADEGGRRG